MLSSACKYAIRSILFLAIYADEDHKMGVKQIADSLETPQPFLAKLLQRLRKNGLVSSSKGPGGGFYMMEANFQKSLWAVVECIDNSEKFEQCFLGLSRCSDENPCPVHFTVVPFRNRMLRDFKEKTIEEFVAEVVRKGWHISLKDLEV